MTRVFFAAFCLFLLLAPREPWGGEAQLQVARARAIVAHGDLDVAADGELPHTFVRDGRRYVDAPLGPTLPLVPVELLARLLPRTAAGARVTQLLEGATAAVAGALVVALLYGWTRRRWVVLLLVATTLTVYARVPDGSAWAALLVLLSVERARRYLRAPSAREAVLLGLAASSLVLFDLPAVTLTIFAFALVFAPSRRPLAWVLPSFALAILAALWSRVQPAAGGDLLEGLDGLLLSTGKSVFAYSPVLVLAIPAMRRWWRTRRTDALLWLAVAVAVILPAAGLERWDGDPAWGPRRLVALVPLFIIPVADWLEAASLRMRRALIASLVSVGLFVQLLGVAFPPETYLRVAAVVKNGSGASGWFAVPDQAHFFPQFSPLVGHAWLLWHLVRPTKKLEASPPWKLIDPTTPRLDTEQKLLRLDWWALSLARDNVKR